MKLENITPENFIEEAILADLKSGRSKKVITRCPPEPSGYWHIGHCKAWIIDFETAKKFGGFTYLRMDDTNPTKEDGDFAKSYVDDLRWLGYTPKKLIYASESYFEKIYKIAEKMIKKGYAYVDQLSAEEVSATRGTLTEPGKNSPYRDRPASESLKMFRDMRAGKYKDGEVTLRAKIDMSHPNMNMRDPVMYRVLRATHYKTGDKWCIYPMYDFAHPMEDALEGVTYSICDINFEDHRPVYNWFIKYGWGKKYAPQQMEFGKLLLENVLLGKRYLKRLVNEGKVMGWDDPRYVTIVGMKRRGYTANGVKEFIKSVGVSKSESFIPFEALEYYIRNDLNLVATRAMAVLDPLKVVITNYNGSEQVELENNPNDANAGKHEMSFSNTIFIDSDDFSLDPPPKYNRLVLGGVVRLKGAYIIKCNNVVYKEDGSIDHLECEYYPNSRSGSDTSGIKCKGTIHFVDANNYAEVTIRNFKQLIKDEYKNPAKALAEGTDVEDMIDKDSLSESKAYVEKYLLSAKVGDKFQFVRKGYYCLDKDSTPDRLVFNNTISLKDSYKPTK